MSTETEQSSIAFNGEANFKNVDDEQNPARPPTDAPCPPKPSHDSLPNSLESSPVHKKLNASQPTSPAHSQASSTSSQKRPPFDTRLMSGFYEACVSKFFEKEKKWNTDWQLDEYPLELVKKNRVYELVRNYMKAQNEQCVLIQNFDYSDLQSFENFLHSLKYDGLNSISKYKQYLESRDMSKSSLDLVLLHAKYGLVLIETKESDYLDNRRRMKIKNQLSQVRMSFENLFKLINDAKGLYGAEQVKMPVTEVLALPNVYERPKNQDRPAIEKPISKDKSTQDKPQQQTQQSNKQLNYLIKSDMEDFGKWWQETVVEKYVEQPVERKTKLNAFTSVLSVINCVRNNLVIPTINEEIDNKIAREVREDESTVKDEDNKPEEPEKPEPAKKTRYNICAEFFDEKHERLRTWSKVCLSSNNKDKLRRSVAMQILWVVLNDTQKKLSVVTSDKPYYEEYFAKQRKLYNTNLNNVRFYSDMHSCPDTADAHTLRKDNEMWLFVSTASMLNDVFERTKDLRSYWVFAYEPNMDELKASLSKRDDIKYANLDEQTEVERALADTKPWLNDLKLKFPIRLTSDLLVIGDVIAPNQTKLLNDHLKESLQSKYYQPISKRLRSVKYLRGGSVENLRQTLKMHDQIQSKIVLLHVGDEDLFKTRNPQATIDHIRELAGLIKEYCPKSFVVISTLMRRMSKTENQLTSEVNKGIISFCKQSKDTFNYHYMLNNHFNPDYHTYEGRSLSNKGLRLYVDNILFVVDYFYVRKNKQN